MIALSIACLVLTALVAWLLVRNNQLHGEVLHFKERLSEVATQRNEAWDKYDELRSRAKVLASDVNKLTRPFLIWLFAISTAWAQQVATPPPENRLPHLSIFTSSQYRSIPAEAAIVHAFEADPNLVKLRRQTNFHHYTDQDPLYKTRYAKTVPLDRFPAIMLQRADGGYVYKATGSNVPAATAIFDEMLHYASLDPLTGPADSKEARPWRPWQVRDISYQLQGVPDVNGPPFVFDGDCPDGKCPLNPDTPPVYPPSDSSLPRLPDSIELGGRHPVRETGAVIVIAIGLFIGAVVLFVGGLIVLGLVWLVSRSK